MRPCHLAPSESKYLRYAPKRHRHRSDFRAPVPGLPAKNRATDAPSAPGTEARRSEGSEKNPTNDRTSAEGHKARRTFTSLSAGPETATPHPDVPSAKSLTAVPLSENRKSSRNPAKTRTRIEKTQEVVPERVGDDLLSKFIGRRQGRFSRRGEKCRRTAGSRLKTGPPQGRSYRANRISSSR